MKQKKGQLYLFAAIILIGLAFALTRINLPQETERNHPFKGLTENFASEAPKMLNYAIQNEENVTAQMMQFMETFHDYAKTKDPHFEMTMIVMVDDQIIVLNQLNEEFNISSPQQKKVKQDEYVLLTRTGAPISIGMDDTQYNFIDDGIAEVKAILRSNDGNNVRIELIS